MNEYSRSAFLQHADFDKDAYNKKYYQKNKQWKRNYNHDYYLKNKDKWGLGVGTTTTTTKQPNGTSRLGKTPSQKVHSIGEKVGDESCPKEWGEEYRSQPNAMGIAAGKVFWVGVGLVAGLMHPFPYLPHGNGAIAHHQYADGRCNPQIELPAPFVGLQDRARYPCIDDEWCHG